LNPPWEEDSDDFALGSAEFFMSITEEESCILFSYV
jgi:hypothetical protein